MDAGVQEAFIQAARGRGEAPMLLPSGPAHDAAAFGASGIPTGMLFVPSIGGLSHCPEENTAEEDLLLGAQVLEDALRALAGA
jgi:acetylornithine deacetylase/succinyl-diaminopimelate desuccinylase-like protein